MDSKGRQESQASSADQLVASPPLGGLTAEILEQFRQEVLKTGQFPEALVGKLLELATAGTRPRAKDFEALLQEEEPLE